MRYQKLYYKQRCNMLLLFGGLKSFQIVLSLTLFLFATSSFADSGEPRSYPILHAENTFSSGKSDIVFFRNGDKSHGLLSGGNYVDGIIWKSNVAKQKSVFYASTISSLLLNAYTMPDMTKKSSIVFTNGDSLSGSIESFEQGLLLLKTPLGGNLNIKKEMIKSIVPPDGNNEILYVGPVDTSNWKISSWGNSIGESVVKDGELVIASYSNMGRDVHLPDKARIDFYFESTGHCQFYFVFCSDKVQGRLQNNYSLNIFPGYIYLQKYSKDRKSSINLGNAQCPEFRDAKGHVTLFVDRESGKIILMANDKQIKQWVDANPLKEGTFISFLNQSQSILKIRNITVSNWSGSFLKDPSEESLNKTEDVLVFMNDDFTYGHFKGIKDGFLEFASDEAEYSVAINKVKKISFASNDFHLPRKNHDDIRCIFPDSGKLTLKLNRIDQGIIKGSSENFGDISLNLKFVKKIDLNIYYDTELDQ